MSDEQSLLFDLQLTGKPSDLLSDEERQIHDLVINTFEKIAEGSMTKSIKTVIAMTADELNIEASDVSRILDAHYAEEEAENAVNS